MCLGLQRLLRGPVGHPGLAGRLVLPDANQVGPDAEPIERIPVVVALAAHPLDPHHAQRVHQHFTGMGRQVVLALIERGSPGDHRLSGRLEGLDRGGGFAQTGQPRALEAIEQQQHAVDPIVAGGLLQRLDQIPEPHAGGLLAAQLLQRRLTQALDRLLDQRPLEFENQHAVPLDTARAERDHGHHAAHQHRQQQQVRGDPAPGIERPPEPGHQGTDPPKHGDQAIFHGSPFSRAAVRRPGQSMRAPERRRAGRCHQTVPRLAHDTADPLAAKQRGPGHRTDRGRATLCRRRKAV